MKHVVQFCALALLLGVLGVLALYVWVTDFFRKIWQ